MTAVIISILCALGIGGGVMVASSGGGSSSGGAAVVAPVNPGNNTGGGTTTGGTTTGGSTTGGTTTGGGSTTGGNTTASSSNVGALLARKTLSGVTVIGKGAQGNTTLSGNNLTIGIDAYAPILIEGNSYKTNEIYKTVASTNKAYINSYLQSTENMLRTINLGTVKHSYDYYDLYSIPAQTTKTLGSLYDAKTNKTYNNVTWTFQLKHFALGARKLGLQNSEFGFYNWESKYTNSEINNSATLKKRFDRFGGQSFYMFRTSKQFTGSDYIARYGNNATFKGNVIGAYHYINYACFGEVQGNIHGDITLSLNLANKTISGTLTNMVLNSANWYNFTVSGVINTATAGSPNITFTNINYDSSQTDSIPFNDLRLGGPLLTLNGSSNFGDAVIVKGDNASQDEMVGRINFTANSPQSYSQYAQIFHDVYLSFGAKKQ